MSRKWYGSLNNRIEEGRMFCDKIAIGTGVTEYSWSDRHAYEVTEVTDQKHIKVREYDHKLAGEPMTNNWELISNPENPERELVKRGEVWYWASTITAADIADIDNDIDFRIRLVINGFDIDKIRQRGKQTKYSKANVSFGVADYYYDYEF